MNRICLLAPLALWLLSACTHIKWASGASDERSRPPSPKPEQPIPVHFSIEAADGRDMEWMRTRILQRNFVESAKAPWAVNIKFKSQTVPENGGFLGGIYVGVYSLSLGLIPLYSYTKDECTVEVYRCTRLYRTYAFFQKEHELASSLLLPLSMFTGVRSESMQLDLFEPKNDFSCPDEFERVFLEDYRSNASSNECNHD